MKKTKTRGKSPAKARVVDSPLDALSEPLRGPDASVKAGSRARLPTRDRKKSSR